MERLPDNAFTDQIPRLAAGAIGDHLGPHLEHRSRLLNAVRKRFQLLELLPMGQRLLAEHILASLHRVQGLEAVMSVRGGDGDDVHRRVGEELAVVHVRGAARCLGRGVQARAVHITDRGRT